MSKYTINDFALANFNLRLVEQTDDYVEYTDGIRNLLVTKDHFIYSFKSSNEAVPVSPDIAMLSCIIRQEVLKTEEEYSVFKSLVENNKKKALKEKERCKILEDRNAVLETRLLEI